MPVRMRKIRVSPALLQERKMVPHSGRWFGILLKKKKTLNTHLTYKATTTLLGIYPEEMENLSSRKNLLANVCSNWICYNRNLGTIEMSRDGRTVRRTVVPPCHGKLLSEEEEQTTDM